VIALLLSLVAFAADTPTHPIPTGAATVSASVVVKVGVPEATADAVVEKAEALGGWFSARTKTQVTLRVPVERHEELLLFVADQGLVADRTYAANDVSAELEDAKARLRAREGVLGQYEAVLATAGPKSIVAVERQIVQVVQEIEQLKGRIRYLEHQADFATVVVSFTFRDRAAPARDGSSSFAWLNTLNLQDVVADFRRERAWWKTKGVDPAVPEGFSAFRKPKRFRAVTPDEVVYRVRTEKHEPEAELAFWKEALKERMVAAGYRVVAESEIQADGATGALLELQAPYGTQDYGYVVAVFPVGKKLVLAEAAGEITKLQARREAVLGAIRALDF
jgi:hypothetical protein